jgi:hypothetical protein
MIRPILEWFWNLEILKGHRSQIAKIGLMLASAAMAYQGIATSDQLAAQGIDLWDIPSGALAIIGVVSAFFAGKMKKFVKEHEG